MLPLEMRVLITSDNHLGHKESDPLLGQDSFDTFSEILQVAVREHVDLILQAGDLFDENRPSRHTYNCTIQLLRKYCLGKSSVTIRSSTPMNWEDRKMQVSLPILSIHGNHDDPSGFGSVSPHDILSSAGLINYFGKAVFNEAGTMELVPILLETEGGVKLAVYGLGYINNRRAYRLFSKGMVEYRRPPSAGWYNILLLHQNRVPREEDYLDENHIAPFFDLVVYGHEHESITIKRKDFDVIQCGSTVRTSLCEGEKDSKYVYILDIPENESEHTADRKQQVKTERISLNSVRPFIMDSIKIETNPDSIIRQRLDAMMEQAKRMNSQREHCVFNNKLPLLRLRVELHGCDIMHKHSIIEYLKGKVANEGDVLRIIKKKETRRVQRQSQATVTSIFDVYSNILKEKEFTVLRGPAVMAALGDYLRRADKHAFEVLVTSSVQQILRSMDLEGIILENITEMLRQAGRAIQKGEERLQASSEEEGGAISAEEDIHPEEKSVYQSESQVSSLSNIEDLSSLSRKDPSNEAGPNYTFLEQDKEEEERIETIKRIKDENKGEEAVMLSDDELMSFSKYL